MTWRRELAAFAATLTLLAGGLLHQSLLCGKLLSPADVLLVSAAFEGPDYEPANRLLIDPALQFQPWLEFNRAQLRRGRLPLWNDLAGCGAPHLANAQSGVFDPFHLPAYLGPLPEAHAWIACARLVFAGLGMFLLARAWGLAPWGRWFAGLTYPFCGFVIVWLLFPVTAAAIWLPWAFLATERVLQDGRHRSIGLLALAVGGSLLAGHVQTSAHLLMATGSYAVIRCRPLPLLRWTGGVLLGVGLAAAVVLPLSAYLTRSPVWADRVATKPPAWSVPRPRLPEAACTALPYLFGSQRRGHPHLAKAVGADNFNESAGGFAGLATLIWLAPGTVLTQPRRARVRFLAGLVAVGALGAFQLPPVANLLRLLPVVEVIDHRRLSLWVAFGLCLLGGMGLEALAAPRRRVLTIWTAAAVLLLLLAASLGTAAPWIRTHAAAHYQRAAAATPGADPNVFQRRAARQVRQTLRFVPSYLALAAAQLLVLAGLGWAARRRCQPLAVRGGLATLVALDLFGFAYGFNPAIPRAQDRPDSELIATLRQLAPPPARILTLDPELPPNSLMRYGLADLRNYDSIETSAHFAAFETLYEPGPTRTSRRQVSWSGVARARTALVAAGVKAVVGPTPPPEGLFPHVARVRRLWIGTFEPNPAPLAVRSDHGRIDLTLAADHPPWVSLAVTYDPGWHAWIKDQETDVRPDSRGAFLAVRVPPGPAELTLRYEPAEVRLGLTVSLVSACLIGCMLVSRSGAQADPKTPLGAWMVRRGRVRIDLVIPGRSGSPAHPEGRNADGPLHV